MSPPAEPPLPDTAFVLRAGKVEVWSLKANAINHHVDALREGRDEWAVSVASRGNATVDALAMEAGEKVWKFNERERMRVTTVGILRAKGYDVVPDDLPHALILLPDQDDPPADTDFIIIESAFGPQIDNPAYVQPA